MAVATIPKSAVRKEGEQHLISGFAELPTIDTEDGTCWVLPGGHVICDPEKALQKAEELDVMIRANVRKTGRNLLH